MYVYVYVCMCVSVYVFVLVFTKRRPIRMYHEFVPFPIREAIYKPMTGAHIYIYACVCVCVCVKRVRKIRKRLMESK